MVSKFPDVASRLTHVMEVCGYPSQAALMDAIGRRSAQWGSWVKRGNYGNGGDMLLKEVTGVSIDWLKTGQGEPFPNGPIRCSGAGPADVGLADRLAKTEQALDVLAGVVAALLRAMRRESPSAAADVAAALEKAAGRPDAPAFLPELLAVVEPPGRGSVGGGAPHPRKRK